MDQVCRLPFSLNRYWPGVAQGDDMSLRVFRVRPHI